MTEVVNQIGTTLFGATGFIPTAFAWVTSSEVLPFFCIGIACSGALFAVKAIKSVVWGA